MKTCNTCGEEKPYSGFEKSNYSDGYRPQCKACRKRKKEERLAKGMPSTVKHGKYGTYTDYKCRCQPCRSAAYDHTKKQKEKALQLPIPAHLHGRVATYRHLHCRCVTCSQAEKEYKSKRWAAMSPEQKQEHKMRYLSHAVSGRRTRRTKEKQAKLPIADRHIANAYLRCSINDPCAYCGERKAEMHWDHFYPVNKGGTDHWWNMRRACKDCNLTKYNRCGTWMLLRGKVNV